MSQNYTSEMHSVMNNIILSDEYLQYVTCSEK